MCVEVDQPVAAAAMTQVKLCPYSEEELAIWFRLVEAQFTAAGIKSQKLKYAYALASVPKQVLHHIFFFWTQSMPATSHISRLTISKLFCWGNLARANGSPTLSCFVSHYTCKASGQTFSWVKYVN
jgi:hypothetical protein